MERILNYKKKRLKSYLKDVKYKLKMKKLNIVLVLFGLIFLSCSSDDNSLNKEPELNSKKLIKVTQEGNYGIYEKQYFYDSNNRVTEIESSFTEFGQTTSDIHNIIFSYDNNLIVSAIDYENDVVYKTFEFNYSDDNLTEKIIYDSNEVEEEKLEFTYNSNNKVESFNYYVESNLQQTQNFIYNASGNIMLVEDVDYCEIQYDTNPTPSDNFTHSNKIILEAESILVSLSSNNEINKTTTYNYSQPGETIRHFVTTITYDADNYPVSKVVVQTDNNGNEINTRTTIFEYE